MAQHPAASGLRRLAGALVLACAIPLMSGCVAVKVVATPVTVARDLVDAPLVSLTNVFLYFAQQTKVAKAPGVGVGWSLTGPTLGIGYDISHFIFMGVTGILGGVDYVVCRSLYPNWPNGVSPWKKKGQSWGSLYFPNTRVLWGDDRPIFKAPPPDADAPAPESP